MIPSALIRVIFKFSVNILCAVAIPMLFCDAISLIVWRASYPNEFCTSNFKVSMMFVGLPAPFVMYRYIEYSEKRLCKRYTDAVDTQFPLCAFPTVFFCFQRCLPKLHTKFNECPLLHSQTHNGAAIFI